MGAGARNYLYATLITSGLLGAVDLLWLPYSTVSFSPLNWHDIRAVALCICLAGLVSWLVTRRLRDDRSRAGQFVRRASDFLGSLVLVAAAFVPLLICTTILMHVASATGRPLADPVLAAIDARMGFDWLWFLSVTNNKLVAPVLIVAYHALGPQVPFVLLLNIATNRNDRSLQFIAMLAVSSVLAGAIMALVPAEGAYAYFKPTAEQFNHFTAQAGMWHHETLMALRSGEPFDLIMTRSNGLVTFPSYHTALGIIVVYALRDYRWLMWPIAVLNALMIIATLPEGGHHLIDVLAGAMVGVASIFAVRMIGAYERGKADSVARSAVGSEAGR
ncbi:phosphatase PAP2 family protein [Mesorhizobium onobrychidis]|uniref:Phosphatase PAP2 family protein n=1 Tax=Mesorhizobium onobrychidis TaxID=2775404 RepID=A0ABY5R0I1_9HYPH|nr:phosphatase PAP2 family protein [Mesorhizobium onobrychidis]UVC16913.1 phosphatase PAP2 family protein [Mesorhizobium onobrychidis]